VLGCACDSLDHCTCGAAYLARRGRLEDAPPGAVLHVTNGDSAGNTLRQTSLGGAVLPWNDVLHEGPVPAVPPPELRAARACFLSACGWGSDTQIRHSLERRDEQLERALAERRHVVLWFEHDLYDQLQVLQILASAAHADSARTELIEVGSFEGHPDFRGLGELNAGELETLWSKRRPVTPELVALACDAWDAFTASEPTAIATFLGRVTQALPFLADALRRLLEELPDTEAGLSRSEREVLESLADGPQTPWRLFLESQEREEAPFEGDAWFWRRLSELGSGDRPLLVRVDGEPVGPPPPLGEPRAFAAATLELTDDGRAVLAGEADRIALLGIDRWLGGTHLEQGHVWRRDRATGEIGAE
jgi:hypothetical protein